MSCEDPCSSISPIFGGRFGFPAKIDQKGKQVGANLFRASTQIWRTWDSILASIRARAAGAWLRERRPAAAAGLAGLEATSEGSAAAIAFFFHLPYPKNHQQWLKKKTRAAWLAGQTCVCLSLFFFAGAIGRRNGTS